MALAWRARTLPTASDAGLLLMAAASVALIIANSPFADNYHGALHAYVAS